MHKVTVYPGAYQPHSLQCVRAASMGHVGRGVVLRWLAVEHGNEVKGTSPVVVIKQPEHSNQVSFSQRKEDTVTAHGGIKRVYCWLFSSKEPFYGTFQRTLKDNQRPKYRGSAGLPRSRGYGLRASWTARGAVGWCSPGPRRRRGACLFVRFCMMRLMKLLQTVTRAVQPCATPGPGAPETSRKQSGIPSKMLPSCHIDCAATVFVFLRKESFSIAK